MFARILLLCLLVRLSVSQEPHCSSFTFLEQLLEKLVRMESRVGELESQIKDNKITSLYSSSGKMYCYCFIVRFKTFKIQKKESLTYAFCV